MFYDSTIIKRLCYLNYEITKRGLTWCRVKTTYEIHRSQKVYERFCLPRIRPLRCDHSNGPLSKSLVCEVCVCVSEWVSVCVCVGGGGGGGGPVLSMLENNNAWVHRDYVCLLVKEADWVVSVHNIFCRFVISLQIFTNGSKLIPLLVHIIYWITETLIFIHKLLLTDNLKIISLFIRSCQSNMFQYYFYMCTVW